MEFAARKLYYKIGEVCDIVGVEAHVLRYWESEFPSLSPPKNKAGQRTYRPKDIEQLLEIRKLLYDEGFTIAGARKRLGGRVPQSARARRAPAGSGPEARSSPPRKSSKRLNQVREELENILTLLRGE